MSDSRSSGIGWVVVAMVFGLLPPATSWGGEVQRQMEPWEKKVWEVERVPVEHWVGRLETLDELLRSQAWSEAEFEVGELLKEMVHLDGGGQDHPWVLARAVAYRALAEAALGRREDALWHWYLAQNLNRGQEVVRLADYEEPGAFLAGHPLEGEAVEGDLVDVYDPGGTLEDLTPPVRIKTVYPRRPAAFRRGDFSQVVFVQVVIDRDGSIRRPLVVDTGGYPTLIYSALEALRQWKFEPARLKGEPIPLLHVIAVTFADDRPEEYNPILMGGDAEVATKAP